MTSASLFWGVVFGAIGTGYCIYAKRRQAMVAGICGFGLIAVPYLLDNTYAMVAVCVALTAGPFVIEDPW